MEKIPYLRSPVAVCDNAVNFFMVTEPLPSSTWLFIQHISIEDRTSGADAVRFGYGRDVANPHWWEEQLTIVVNTVRWMEKELHFVPEGHRVIIRVDGATLDDRLFAEVEGYTIEKVEGTRPFKPRKRE